MRKSQNKKVPQRIIAGIVLVGIVFVGLFYSTQRTQAGWYDDNWAYRKVINITDHTAEEKNVYLNLTGGSALDTQGASKTNCGDIRFTDANGKVLPYYIVSGCKTASTVVHIFFDTFPAGAQTIYYYYGNPSARDGFSLTDFSTAATGVTFGSYGSQEVGPGPVAYWKFDEGYGTTINSNTQTGPSMTLAVGSGTPWTTEERCVSGKCLFFNATGNVTANTSISDIRTVQFWVKPKTTTGFLFSVDGTDSLGQVTASSGTITASGTLNGSTFYINGTYTATPTLVANVWQHITVVTPSNTTMSAFFMGEMGGAPTFTGFVDEVKLYRSVRSATEIKSDVVRWATAEGSNAILSSPNINNVGPFSNGLVGYWKMDEASWTNDCATATVMDASGNGSHGLSCPASTGPTGGSIGKYGNGAIYDYVDNYISINNSTVYAPLNEPFSASAWVYLNSFSDNYPTILRLRSDDTQPWFIIFSNQTSYLGVSIGNQANFAGIKTDVAAASLTGKWLHVVATYNGKGSSNINNFKIYLDGTLLTNSASGTYASHSQATSIGYNSSGNRWNGYIDEVRVYNRELTNDDVKNLYSWAPGPVGHWKMDEGIGQTIYDTSGNNNSLTLGASTATGTDDPSWVTGKFGKALQFDGNNDYAFVGDSGTSALDMSGNMTITTWFYKNQDTDTNSWADLVTKSDTSAFDTNYWFQIHDVSDVEFLDFYFSNDNGSYEVRGTQPIQLNTWHHAAVVYNDAANTIQFYLDGVPQSGSNVEVFGTNGHLESLRTNNEDLRVGSTYANQQFPGAIDDVKIYNYARTSTQIVEDLNAGHPAPGSPVGSPLLHLSFDEGYGDTVYDSSGQLNHGNLSGSTTCPSASICPTWSNEGKFGKAMYFGALQTGDGDSHIRLENDKYDALTEGSLSFWFKSDGVGTDNDIFGAAEDDNGSGSDFVGVLFNAQDSMLNLGVSNNGSLVLNVITAAIPNPTAWHHAVVNMSANGHEIYVDGKKQTLSYFTGDSSTSVWFDDIAESTTAYTIGCLDADGSDTNDCNGNGFFAGLIDEFKLFAGPLTQEQVNIEYNGGASQRMGAVSTTSDGVTSSNASSREYCVPGDTSTCNAPIARWMLDENTGISAQDVGGGGYVGTLTAGPRWTIGKFGGAVNFDGLDDFISVPYNANLDPTSNITVSFWFKPSQTIDTSLSTYKGILSKASSNTDADNDWVFFWESTEQGRLRFGTYGDNVQTTSNTWVAGKWYHVAATVSGGSTAYIYVNGVRDNYNSDTSVAGNAINGTTNTPLNIGLARVASGDQFFNGSIDDVRIYNYARTASQIAWDYNKGAPTHIYKFNECQGTTIYDSAQTSDGKLTGRVGTLTIGGTGTYTSAGSCTSGSGSDLWYGGRVGKFGSGLALDGTNDYSSIPSPSLPTGEFTYTAWIYLDSLNNERTVVMASDGSGANEILLSVVSDQDGTNPSKVRFTADGLSRYSVNPLETGKWIHLAYTRSATHRTLYINGVYDSDTTSGMNALNFSTCQLFIGVDSDTSGCATDLNEYFDGIIDDVRVYSYALNPIQIRTVMNEGSAVRFGP